MDKDIDMLGAIELAMEAEDKAHTFYKEGAEKTEHPRGKDLFLQLADFEKNHYDHLKRLHESLSGSGQYIDYGGTSFSKSEVEATSEVAGEPKKTEVLEILNMAIGAEREAQKRYADLAGQTSDPSGRNMFQTLSEEEGVHLRILNDEYYNIANQGSWSSKSLWSE
ncbi:MAG: ferritin family protein [Gemmatimonadota bacterium]|nr:MAG: ferritin family protein [Gemmatimonadota bacterium]